ncbi:MAG: ketopantoate reductase family protein [Chloroflexi bacterium]|nr:ketopantoate reductase family protein [Chloroflexota bacterium]
MRTVIYGAGGIGSVVGGYLKLAGQDVILVGRPGHVRAINDRGLRIISPSGTRLVRLNAVTGADELEFRDGDVSFLCVKGQDTERALDQMAPAGSNVPVFCFQNGVRNEALAARFVKDVYGVMVDMWVEYLVDGEVTVRADPPGRFVIGRYPSGTDPVIETVAAGLRSAGFYVKVTPDVMPYKWGKLIANLGNAVDAVCKAKPQDVAFIYHAARREARDILSGAGVSLVSLKDLDREWPESAARTVSGEGHGSTWQSLARRGAAVETDFLNGEIVRLARRLGLPAPVNEGLLRLCEEMVARREPPGKYTGDELAGLLGLK